MNIKALPDGRVFYLAILLNLTSDPMEEKKNYKTTLNLPQTAFAMEAKLTANEPARLKRWNELKLYDKLMSLRADGEKWVLHDGPPFANGDIHIGHVINKTLKDIILRFRSMQGYQTPYVPGWDCHGLPIEHKIQQDLGPKLRQMDVTEVRKLCHEYADKYVKIQSEQFQRLGILGEWNNPYLTMSRDYEAATLEVFARFVEAGLVYKKLKPVPWSIENQTALADAELEYKDVEDTSVYVEFPLDDGFLIVWTTTPWTLPANLAVAVNSEVDYATVKYRRNGQDRIGFVAANLVERVFKDRAGVESFEIVGTRKGIDLLSGEYRHPFVDGRRGKVVAADYVTTTDGTGLVHTAPGHGEDDYETGIREKLTVYSPVLANGRFDETVPEFIRGKTVRESNPIIVEELKRRGLLLAEEKIIHSYPHDWRSKKPVIFRATEQWFIDVNKPFSGGGSLRQRAMAYVDGQIDFVPKWGKARFAGMIESRPDWCVSRQRAWGMPMPVFYNEKGEALLTPQSVRAVAGRFAEKGSEAWFTDSPKDLLGADFRCPPGFSPESLRKEKDIFDVWFESGSSWHTVLEARPKELQFPADLYLEGSDQHRGWFQLSLLLSLGVTGKPPFKQVLTHGFSVKPDGTKVSKSDKEYVTATQEINKHGADLLRLWCSSVDYQNDIPTSPAAIQEFGDKYRKIRNTLRYLLSNLYDFDPLVDSLAIQPASLDGWAMAEVNKLIGEVTAAYDAYQLHRAFRLLHDFCAVQSSAVYGNAMKDRLYCETVMRRMADCLIRLLAPILVFTADEAWEHLPHKTAEESALAAVHLLLLPEKTADKPTEDQKHEWALLMELRDQALAQLDGLKKSVGLNKALDAELVYRIDDDELRRRLQNYGPDLEDMVGAGCHSFAEKSVAGPAAVVEVVDRREKYKACARSWKRRPDVGEDLQYPDLSLRDAAVVRSIERK
jgi:isoleucyl-tRNA synthetase